MNRFWSIKNSNEVISKLKSEGCKATALFTYDFSTLYTTLPHHLIKDKIIDLIEHTFSREKALYLVCNDQRDFFTSDEYKNYNLWSCQKVCEALVYVLDNIFIMPRHQKVAGYYVIPSEILSVRPSVRLSVRPSVRQRPPPFLYRQLLLQF